MISQRGALNARAFGWGRKNFIAVTSIGTNSGTGATVAITVPAGGVPAGSSIYVYAFEYNGSGGNGTFADSGSNTYSSIGSSTNANNNSGAIFQAFNVTALTSAQTITYTQHGGADFSSISAFYVTGLTTTNPFDAATLATVNFVSNTNPVANTSGTPAQGGELFIAMAGWANVGTAGYTLDSGNGWTTTPPTLKETNNGGGVFVGVAGGVQINAGTGTKVTQPTFSSLSGGANGVTVILGLKHP